MWRTIPTKTTPSQLHIIGLYKKHSYHNNCLIFMILQFCIRNTAFISICSYLPAFLRSTSKVSAQLLCFFLAFEWRAKKAQNFDQECLFMWLFSLTLGGKKCFVVNWVIANKKRKLAEYWLTKSISMLIYDPIKYY